MKFHKKYRHVGASCPSVPDGWVPIVKEAIVSIEKAMWPRWIPLPVRWLIHWLAYDNSYWCVKYTWGYHLRQRVTQGQIVQDIKEKFAGLRIYGSFGDEIDAIIESAEMACSKTCQHCGSVQDVAIIDVRWLYALCPACADVVRSKAISRLHVSSR